MRLRYRDFLTVGVDPQDADRFNDNWIYIHDPGVKVGPGAELQIVVARDGARSASYCCYGLEYFCFEGDRIVEFARTRT